MKEAPQASAHVLPSEESLAIAKRLIGFQTVSRESNLELIEWVKSHVERIGASVRLTRDITRKKANLFATFGDPSRPGLVLSGHSDVVPVDGQVWSSDPFAAEVRDGRLYGRGACDMKGFIAVCLSALERFPRRDDRSPIHLSLSYDEELGCLGVGGLLDDIREQGIRPSGCIVGEPTRMQVIVAHKGKRAYRCCVKGQAAHSSVTPAGVNAVEFASDLICRIREEAKKLRHGKRLADFDVPFTTMTTTVIQGGISVNTIPEDCEFTFEYRYLPGVDPNEVVQPIQAYARNTLVPEMRKTAPSADISFSRLSTYPGLDLDERAALAEMVKSIRQTGHVSKVAFGSEAGLFQAAGVPSIVCGPGDIQQAHKADEYVELAQLAECEMFIQNLLMRS